MNDQTVSISSKAAIGFIFASGVMCCLTVVFAILLFKSQPQITLNEMLGCLPGTQATLENTNIGERQDSVVAKCAPVKK